MRSVLARERTAALSATVEGVRGAYYAVRGAGFAEGGHVARGLWLVGKAFVEFVGFVGFVGLREPVRGPWCAGRSPWLSVALR
jgi:hypothetical protein